jgi:putative SOS response-associated peptidase YedK
VSQALADGTPADRDQPDIQERHGKCHMNWLNLKPKNSDEINPLLKPYSEAKMDCYPVSPLVNSPKHDSPEACSRLVQRTILWEKENNKW